MVRIYSGCFAVGLVAIVAAGPALAADLPETQQPLPPAPQAPAAYIPPPPAIYNWGGIYIGINGGYGFGSSTWSNSPQSTGSFNTTGGLVGSTIGFNVQTDEFVFGLEGDIDWLDISGSPGNAGTSCQTVTGVPAGIGTLTNCTTKNDWLGTVRLRAGYAFDRVLLYLTGGGAFGDIQATTVGSGSGIGSVDSTEFGWTAGVGVEAALAQNWTVKAEYLFVDLANGSWSCSTCGTTTTSVSSYTSLARVGLNYKFNF